MKGKSRAPQRGKRHDTPRAMLHPPASGLNTGFTIPSSHSLQRETEQSIKQAEVTLAKTPKLLAKEEKRRK